MSRRLRACDVCGERRQGRTTYTIGWTDGAKAELVVCPEDARPLAPFLQLALKKGRRPPIRPLKALPPQEAP